MMRIVLPALVQSACASAPPPTPVADEGFVPAGYQLVWNDEFDGTALDPRKWRHDQHANAKGWYNNELQYYGPDNTVVVDGLLKITARREDTGRYADSGGQRYTSSRIVTDGLASFRHGYVSVRAKLPCGAGSWPAIWTLGEGRDWPDGGEIDIMEHVGIREGRVQSNLHMPATVQGRLENPEGHVNLPDVCKAFHDYQVEFTPDVIRFFVDGEEYNSYEKSAELQASVPGSWPFDRPQYLLLNLAIGGDMGGRVDDGIFPVTFEVDHVRVYQVTRADER